MAKVYDFAAEKAKRLESERCGRENAEGRALLRGPEPLCGQGLKSRHRLVRVQPLRPDQRPPAEPHTRCGECGAYFGIFPGCAGECPLCGNEVLAFRNL